MISIGLSGFAQTGKTTVAQYLEQNYGVRRKHIAEPMREMIRVLMRANGIDDVMIDRYLTGDLKDGVVIPEFGVTSREMQISLGTRWGREAINPNLWADTWTKGNKPGEAVMNDSVRFTNEESAITRLVGGFSILIERPGTNPVAWKRGWRKLGPILFRSFGKLWGAHDSERTDRLNPTYVIRNDGTLDQLFGRIDSIMESRGLRKLVSTPDMALAA